MRQDQPDIPWTKVSDQASGTLTRLSASNELLKLLLADRNAVPAPVSERRTEHRSAAYQHRSPWLPLRKTPNSTAPDRPAGSHRGRLFLHTATAGCSESGAVSVAPEIRRRRLAQPHLRTAAIRPVSHAVRTRSAGRDS